MADSELRALGRWRVPYFGHRKVDEERRCVFDITRELQIKARLFAPEITVKLA